MAETVQIPEDLHAELEARKRPDETVADVIARCLHRPHPEETRAILEGEEASAVADAVEGLYDGDSDRLVRVRGVDASDAFWEAETFEGEDMSAADVDDVLYD